VEHRARPGSDFDGTGNLISWSPIYARWPAEVGSSWLLRVAELGPSYGTPTGFVGRFLGLSKSGFADRFHWSRARPACGNLDPPDPPAGRKGAGGRAPRRQWRRRLDLLSSYHAADSALFIQPG